MSLKINPRLVLETNHNFGVSKVRGSGFVTELTNETYCPSDAAQKQPNALVPGSGDRPLGMAESQPAGSSSTDEVVDITITFEDAVCVLIFVLSFGSLLVEVLRRLSPRQIRTRQSRASAKASKLGACQIGMDGGVEDRLEAGDVSSALRAANEDTTVRYVTKAGRAVAEVGGLEGLDASPPQSKIRGPVRSSLLSSPSFQTARPLASEASLVVRTLQSGRLYEGQSLCFRPADAPRRWAIRLVESRPFDPLVLLTIGANCVLMAWESPLDPCCTRKADFIAASESVFLAIFTTEMLCKILAYGFLGTGASAYLRDPWCQLDFTVLTLAWLPIIFPSMGNYSVVRSVRALRPLRALKRVPGMPVLVGAVLTALPKLVYVALLCGFLFGLFGIFGVEFFKGSLHYRCALPGYEETPGHPALLMIGDLPGSSPVEGARRALKGGGGAAAGGNEFDSGRYCDPHADTCAAAGDESRCAYFDDNANGGALSFDNTAWAAIIILQTITFDTWTEPMYALMDAVTPFALIYFILIAVRSGPAIHLLSTRAHAMNSSQRTAGCQLTPHLSPLTIHYSPLTHDPQVLGGFFLINLFLAVIFDEFVKVRILTAVVRTLDLLT